VDSNHLIERQSAFRTLGRMKLDNSRALLRDWVERVLAGRCPPPVQLDVIEAARQADDPVLRSLVAQYDARAAGGSPSARFAACLEGGDVERGKRVFLDNAELSCRRCHSTRAGENLVGPHLADVGTRRTRNEILESIVDPNRQITEGFQTMVIELDTGEIVSGIVRMEDDEVALLVDAEGRETVVEKSLIVERTAGKSAMPDDLVKHLTPFELRDLVEFLSELKAPSQSASGSQKSS
jgi:quinoprotein glucose dehydrogenase